MVKETNIPSFGEGAFNPFKAFNPYKQFKFPGFDLETLLANYQRNVELMNSTQKIVVEATKSIMELQNDYMKTVFDQWNDQVKSCCSQSPFEEKTAHQTEAAKEALNRTIEHIQGVDSIIAKSNERIMDSVQKRVKEGLDESLKMSKKRG